MTRYSKACGIALLALVSAGVAHADNLKLLPGQAANGPRRGMTMAQVERNFGAPANKLSPAGGDSPVHPVIHRWVYPNYTVYFEREHVIDSVQNGATAPQP
jgi:hypothetical protein